MNVQQYTKLYNTIYNIQNYCAAIYKTIFVQQCTKTIPNRDRNYKCNQQLGTYGSKEFVK